MNKEEILDCYGTVPSAEETFSLINHGTFITLLRGSVR